VQDKKAMNLRNVAEKVKICPPELFLGRFVILAGRTSDRERSYFFIELILNYVEMIKCIDNQPTLRLEIVMLEKSWDRKPGTRASSFLNRLGNVTLQSEEAGKGIGEDWPKDVA
jgi:hypothetical protein